MLLDYFFCTHFGGFVKWNGFCKPGRFHHTLFSVFDISCSVFYQKAYAVDQANLYLQILPKGYRHCLSWDEFRFYSCDHFAGAGKRELVPDLLLHFFIHPRQSHKLHEPADKGGFPGAYRAYNAYVYITAGPCLDIPVNLKILHTKKPSCLIFKGSAAA